MRKAWARLLKLMAEGGALGICSSGRSLSCRRNSSRSRVRLAIADSSRSAWAAWLFWFLRISIFRVQNRYRHAPIPATNNANGRTESIAFFSFDSLFVHPAGLGALVVG